MGSSIGPKMTTSDAIFLIDAGNPRSYAGEGTTNVTCLVSNHQGTRVGGTGYSANNGGSFFFGAGGASTTQYILFNDHPSLNPVADCTVCMWFREETHIQQYTFLQRNTSGSAITGWYVASNTAGATHDISFTKYDGATHLVSSRGYRALTGGPKIWRYICFLPNISGAYTTYLDGTTAQYNIPTTWSSIATTWPFYIGSSTASTKINNISQVQFFNRTLSATEILQNYNAQKSRYGR